MILPAVVLVLLVSVPLAGGRLGRLAELHVRAVWAVACSIALQLLIVDVAASFFPSAVASGLHLASYALVGWFVVANRRIRGLWIVASGGAMNLAAIVANHGVMPASPAAARRAGLVMIAGEFANSAPTAHARLGFLGDVFAVPAGWPLANVFSAGDVVLVIGLGVVVHSACGSRLARRGRAPAAPAHQSPN